MKPYSFAAPAALALLLALAPSALLADSASVHWGSMNTKLLGKGDYVGVAYEFSPVPLLALQLRGGYADRFDRFTLRPPSTEGLSQLQIDLNNMIYGGLNSATSAQLKNFSVIPLEIGVVGRTSVFGLVGLYAGVGYGYYIVPAFKVASNSGIDYARNIDDISGWWGLLGVEGGMPNLKLFGEIKYTRAVARDIGIELEYMGYKSEYKTDLNLSGISYMIGVRMTW